MTETPFLDLQSLTVHFPVRGHGGGVVHAVNEVDLGIARGSTLGLVGESGCGKSTLGRAVAQLRAPTAGRVLLDGQNLTAMWKRGLFGERFAPKDRGVRQRVQMIFQDPYASLNPRMSVLQLVGEPLRSFRLAEGAQAVARCRELLSLVGLPESALHRYPHEFSGGQRQRIGIARAIAAQPEIIVCDEPISALDVSIQAQVLNLLRRLRGELGLTYLFIAHDIAAVRYISDAIAVMYLGRIVEVGPSRAVCAAPQHPYTQALLAAVPAVQPKRAREKRRLPLTAEMPSPLSLPSGCSFHTRCPKVQDRCRQERPTLIPRGPEGRPTACFFP